MVRVFRQICPLIFLLFSAYHAAPALGVTVTASQTPAVLRPNFTNVCYYTLTIYNEGLFGITLRGITLTNTTAGIGTQSQKDAELGTMELYRDDGDGIPEAGQDTFLATATASGGLVRYTSLNQPIAGGLLGGETIRLHVIAINPVGARDGDILDLAVSEVTFQSGPGPLPANPPGAFPVDGMVAAQVFVQPVASDSIVAGTQNTLALSVVLPSNGYEVDQLNELTVINEGTAVSGSELTGIRVWVDDGDGTFESGQDRSLGPLIFTGSRWQFSGFTESVPAAGVRLFFTVDVSDFAAQGRSIRLALPVSPLGIGMRSGNDGPIDAIVRNPDFHYISTADRITLTASPVAPAVVRPGETGVLFFDLAASNAYSTTKTLTGLRLTNATTGPGTQADLDAEVHSLALRVDGNGDGLLGDVATDSLLATATFQGGVAVFGAFTWAVAPGPPRHLFVTSDVSLTRAADSDILSAVLAGQLDVTFEDPTRVVGVWPLDSGGRFTVDGMTAAQITNVGAPGAQVRQDDGPILALDVVLPKNGYASDLLDTLAVENRGSAGVGEISELRLWRDGGDGLFSAGAGDDQDLGPLTWQGGVWRSGLLADPLTGTGSRFYVGLTVSGSPQDSTTVRLAIPVGGVRTRSGNDGPLDVPVENPQTILISNAPLLATLRTEIPASTIGQQVGVSMVVRNAGGEAVTGIVPSALDVSGGGALTPVGGPSPASFDLAPAASDTFRWSYTAAGAGEVTLRGSAQGTGSPSGLPRPSLEATSNTHRIFESVSSIELTAASTMPPTVTLGQTGVTPLRLTFTNNAGAEATPVRISALRIRLEDGSGAGIVPSELLTAVTVGEGANVLLQKTSLETTGAEVSLPLASPVTVAAMQSVTLAVGVDISSTTTASTFRVAILDSTWLTAEDPNSGAPVNARLVGSTYPVRSGLGRLVTAATRLDVGTVAAAPTRVGRGQTDVPLLTLRVESPGQDGITSDAQISSFQILIADTTGAPVARPSDHLARVRVRTALTEFADRVIFSTDGPVLTLVLSPPLTVPVNNPMEVFLVGDVAANARLAAFRAEMGDSAAFDVVDAGTRAPIPAIYATHPLAGPSVTVEANADSIAAAGVPRFPPQVTVGRTDVAAMRAALRHPHAPGTARIRVDTLVVQCRDELRRALTPATFLSRIRILRGGNEIASRADIPTVGGSIGLAVPGVLMEPGDTVGLEIVVDLTASAPTGFLELAVLGSGIRAVDANLGEAVTVVGEQIDDLPLSSGLTRLVSPARELIVGLDDRMPTVLAADGDTIVIGSLTLANVAAENADSIFIDHLVLQAADRNFGAVAIGSASVEVAAFVSGSLWAASAALTPDSTRAWIGGPRLGIPPAGSLEVELRLILATSTGTSTVRVGCDASGIGVIQPSSALLQIQVRPEPGQTFPLWTEAGSWLDGLSLRSSYSNYPNPFAAGREATTFAYYLRRNARVSLRIFTPTGEGVATLLAEAARPAGMNQVDLWNGKNGAGRTVRNGAYLAELIVLYEDGARERALRKVAVVR